MQGARPGRCQLDLRANALRRLAFARETGATVARPALVNSEFWPAAPAFTAPAGAPAADLAQTDRIGAGAAPVFVFEL